MVRIGFWSARIALVISSFAFTTLSPRQGFTARSSQTEGRYCATCAAAHGRNHALNHLPRAHQCSHTPKLEKCLEVDHNVVSAIARVVPAPQRSCYESLVAHESSCSTTVPHDRHATGNANDGIGLCAIETDPSIRDSNNRGPECDEIRSATGQVRCCVHMMKKWGPRYFGTVKRCLTPQCY